MLAITSRHNSSRSLRLRRRLDNYKVIAIVFQHGLNKFERAFLLHKEFCKMRKIIEIGSVSVLCFTNLLKRT